MQAEEYFDIEDSSQSSSNESDIDDQQPAPKSQPTKVVDDN
jgi:hypothetical protein